MNVAPATYTNHSLVGLLALRAHVETNPVGNGDDLMPLVYKFCVESASEDMWNGHPSCPPGEMAIRYLNRAAPSIKKGMGKLLPRTPGEDALLVIDAAIVLAKN